MQGKNKNSINSIHVAAAIIVFLFVLIVVMAVTTRLRGDKRSAGAKKTALQLQGPQEMLKKIDALTASIEGKTRKSQAYIAGNQEGPEITIELLGIISSDKKPLAIVNGEVVAEGDKVGGFVITRIQEEYIIIEDEKGRQRVIHIYENTDQ